MLRFIVYRYIFYKDSKISHASLLTLRHHLSQPPSPTTDLTAPRPAPTLLPPAPPPTSLPHDRPHCPTTCTCPTPPSPTTHLTALPPAPTLLHPALLHTSLPHHLHLPYSTLLYYTPHCPTTSTCPTPPCPPHSPTTCTRPTPLLGYLSLIRLPYLCAHCSLSTPALSPATHTIPHTAHTAHTCHTPHRPAHLPHRCTIPPISYSLYHTALPRHLYPPFSSATFIGLIRPIAPIRPTPTRARIG